MKRFDVRRFDSDKVLASGLSRDSAESFVDDYVTEHGGVLLIEPTPRSQIIAMIDADLAQRMRDRCEELGMMQRVFIERALEAALKEQA